MGRKRTRKRTRSGEGKGGSSVNMIDRFSNLPKKVALHIISRLLIKDLARFCCVSKLCTELCLSTPKVYFCGFGGEDIADMSTCERRLKLVNALDRFLLSRGDIKMQKFDLVWEGHNEDYVDEPPCFCVNESFRIITWIQNAVRCKVEKLHLDVTFYDDDDDDDEGEQLAFPSCVFLCASLRSLAVDMPRTVFKTPSFTFSSNLEELHLRKVVIEAEGFFKWISCSCKLIKKLSLTEINGIDNFIVESSSLEEFWFTNYREVETCEGPRGGVNRTFTTFSF